MGTYLSTPVLDKSWEIGEDLECNVTPAAWGVVDMQGWRKSMEDAHLALSLKDYDCAKIFGVFDGHGGAEVARLCQLYLVSVITSQEGWNDQQQTGKALVDSFHAMDRIIEDPSMRPELEKLKMEKPKPGERRSLSKAIKLDVAVESSDTSKTSKPATEDTSTSVATEASESSSPLGKDKETTGVPQPVIEEQKEQVSQEADTEETTLEAEEEVAEPTKAIIKVVNDIIDEPPSPDENDDSEPAETSEESNADSPEDDDSEYDSGDERVGTEEAAEEREDETGSEVDAHASPSPQLVMSGKEALELFQKILSLRNSGPTQNGTGVVQIESSSEEPSPNPSVAGDLATRDGSGEGALQLRGPQGVTRILNGRQVCNLPDHPVHAGCTSVVAVVLGRTVTVANAGDSRAVLCREGGIAEALSFDHKPMQEREMKRITNAGGFVNQFGRINGNLNLSRSIGDLKYKQVQGIAPADQIITAEPDIVQVTLEDGDEFMILGCDGIWDCLTNEEAVRFVRDRIDEKTPMEIGTEMLDQIVSDDPRVSQGIGGDNMTVMIVDFQPRKRKYRDVAADGD